MLYKIGGRRRLSESTWEPCALKRTLMQFCTPFWPPYWINGLEKKKEVKIRYPSAKEKWWKCRCLTWSIHANPTEQHRLSRCQSLPSYRPSDGIVPHGMWPDFWPNPTPSHQYVDHTPVRGHLHQPSKIFGHLLSQRKDCKLVSNAETRRTVHHCKWGN